MLESYKVADLMPGKVLKLGYPRTGGMLEAAQSDQTELRKMLAPNGEHIYAYMPTWKDYLKVDQVVAESKELLDYLDANLREDQILYVICITESAIRWITVSLRGSASFLRQWTAISCWH